MATTLKLLTDAQWDKIAPLLPEPKRSLKGGPNFIPNRRCFEGVLWILWTGAKWRDLRAGKKRGLGVGKTKRGKGTKMVVVADAQGLPVGVHVCSASPHESRLAEATLAATHGWPRRLIGDRAYDSDPLRARLAEMGIELIVPHRRGRKKPPTQDGRPLRRYKRRWKIERVFAWLGKYRRLVVRWDHDVNIYRAFILIGFIMMLVNQL